MEGFRPSPIQPARLGLGCGHAPYSPQGEQGKSLAGTAPPSREQWGKTLQGLPHIPTRQT